MNKISSYNDLKKYLKSNPLINICWYGPKSTDISELNTLLNINGIVSCYNSTKEFTQSVPFLTNDTPEKRNKCSIDNLATKLILNNKLLNFVRKNNINAILPYDSTPELENFCKKNNILFFSSKDSLKNKLRDKTKIDNISKKINLPAIPGISGIIDDFKYASLVDKLGLPLFLHFAEGAGGSGNHIINTLNAFEKIKIEKKGKKLNVKKYFIGRSCSIDICVTPTSIICGTLEEMLIGAEPLNSNPTQYVGSSWFKNNYSYGIRKKILNIGIAIGELLRTQGFLGFFHPDFLVKNNDIYLTELNMRFGVSCGTYTKAQIAMNQVPLMLAHILTFYNPELILDAKKINEQNLYPLDYGLLVLKNNFGKPIKISHKYKSGIYNIFGDTIKIIEGQKFSDLKNKNSIFINGLPDSKKDTIIEEKAFICEIVTRFPISDTKSKLNLKGKSLVKKIFSELILNNTQL